MSIHSLEDKNRKELVQIIQIQVEEHQKLIKHNSAMQLALMKVLERWWPFVHGSTMPSETAKNIADEVRNAIEGKFK